MQIFAKKITKKYGERKVLDEVSFEMRKGQVLGLLGPNGAGKSTAIKIITGRIEASSGEVRYDTKNIKDLGEKINSLIGIMPQDIIIWDHLSVQENLEYSGVLFGLNKKVIKQRADYLITKLQLGSERKTLARNLSGGYKRRLHLAISIIHDPKIIFLDEPTPGIDPQSRKAMWEFIKELKDTGNYSILLTDHYLDEAEKVCDYIVIIDSGKIVAEGSLKELRKDHGEGKIISVEFEDGYSINKNDSKKIIEKFKNAIILKEKINFPTKNLQKDFFQIIKSLEQLKVKFDDISIKEPSLEDIFLQITGKEIRE